MTDGTLCLDLIIGSGAPETVLPRGWFTDHPFREAEVSRAGEFFVTVDGTEIDNEGARSLRLCLLESQNVLDMDFRVTGAESPM